MPQLFTMISDFESSNAIEMVGYEDNSLCTVISFSVNKTNTNLVSAVTTGECELAVRNISTFNELQINSINFRK